MPLFRSFSTASGKATSNAPSPSSRNAAPPPSSSSSFSHRTSAPAAPPSYHSALRSSVDGVTLAAPQASAGGRVNPNTGAGVQRRSSVEDRLAPLSKYDVAILCDDSPSLLVDDNWGSMRMALMGVVDACARYDKDGIDVYFMNNEERRLQNVSDSRVIADTFDAIQPFGSTPTGVIMDEILRDYVEQVEDARAARTKVKPLLLLVITDGRADDPDLVKDIIIEFAQRLDDVRAPPFQLGVQFIQIGNDPEAREFLQDLDDNLKPMLGVRDMVDTTPFEGSITPEFILKAALGAVVKSIDG